MIKTYFGDHDRGYVHAEYAEDLAVIHLETLDVAGRTLTFNRAVIATGGRPITPPVLGLADVR